MSKTNIVQPPHLVDWATTHEKWIAATHTFRLNLSEVARVSGLSRQHIYGIMRGKTVPSMIAATSLDRAIDICVDRRIERERARARKTTGKQAQQESVMEDE